MIEDNSQIINNPTATLETVDSFSNLIWKEGPKGTWYLDKNECSQNDKNDHNEPEFVNFDMENEAKEESEEKIAQYDKIFYNSKIHTVESIEEDFVLIKEGENENFPVTMDLIKKYIKINALIVGKTKTFLMENLNFNINHQISNFKLLLSEYLSISSEIILLYHNSKELPEGEKLGNYEVKEGDTIVVGFVKNEELIFKRSSSKDYSWYDRKNIIPFTVDKNITVTAFGFFRHYDSNFPAIYDFFLYEVNESGVKKLIYSSNNLTVNGSEVDDYFVKKVPISPTNIKANVKYYAYIYYKGNSDMRTYYVYCGSSEVTVKGVKIKFLEYNEPDHRSSSTSGHLPYIYFKLSNPYEN